MAKNTIKRLVRESLFGEVAKKKEKNQSKLKGSQDNNDKEKGNEVNHEKNTKKDYTDVQHALDKDRNPTGPSNVGIMKAMGIEDDAGGIARSLFGKKLNQDKNDQGGLYQFDDTELATIRGLIPK